jgi:hypothetical protein
MCAHLDGEALLQAGVIENRSGSRVVVVLKRQNLGHHAVLGIAKERVTVDIERWFLKLARQLGLAD